MESFSILYGGIMRGGDFFFDFRCQGFETFMHTPIAHPASAEWNLKKRADGGEYLRHQRPTHVPFFRCTQWDLSAKPERPWQVKQHFCSGAQQFVRNPALKETLRPLRPPVCSQVWLSDSLVSCQWKNNCALPHQRAIAIWRPPGRNCPAVSFSWPKECYHVVYLFSSLSVPEAIWKLLFPYLERAFGVPKLHGSCLPLSASSTKMIHKRRTRLVYRSWYLRFQHWFKFRLANSNCRDFAPEAGTGREH